MRYLFLKILWMSLLLGVMTPVLAVDYFRVVPADALMEQRPLTSPPTIVVHPGAAPVLITYGASENTACKVQIALLSNNGTLALDAAHLVSEPLVRSAGIQCPNPTASSLDPDNNTMNITIKAGDKTLKLIIQAVVKKRATYSIVNDSPLPLTYHRHEWLQQDTLGRNAEAAAGSSISELASTISANGTLAVTVSINNIPSIKKGALVQIDYGFNKKDFCRFELPNPQSGGKKAKVITASSNAVSCTVQNDNSMHVNISNNANCASSEYWKDYNDATTIDGDGYVYILKSKPGDKYLFQCKNGSESTICVAELGNAKLENVNNVGRCRYDVSLRLTTANTNKKEIKHVTPKRTSDSISCYLKKEEARQDCASLMKDPSILKQYLSSST